MDTSNLYWLPFKAVYQQLQAANRSAITELKQQLNLNFQWLLNGLDKFSGPNDKSRSALKTGKSLKASAWGPKRGIAVDKQLIDATIELSQLLELDELQCHLLLKRWLKEDGSVSPIFAAGPAAPKPAASAALALPGPSNAGGAATAPAASAAPDATSALLPAELVQRVSEYYVQERIYLSKCQQFIIMTANNVAADASATCRDVLKRLLDAGWESRVFDNLCVSLTARQSGAVSGSSLSHQSASAYLVKPTDFEQRRHLHQLQERCELLSLLTQLYCGPDPACSPHAHAVQLLMREREDQQDLLSQEEAQETAAVEAAVAEVAGLGWPQCSEDKLQKLLQLVGEAVFLQGTSSSHALGSMKPSAADSARSTKVNQAASLQQLAEALASSVILAALQPAQLLNRLSESAAIAATGGPLPRNITPFKQWRNIEAALMQWRATPGCVLPMLSVFAYNQLLASYRGAADVISPSIQVLALQAGGFAAISAQLALEELSADSLAGGLQRGLALQGISLMASAFDLSPMLLPGAMLQQLVAAVNDTVRGCSHLAQQVWDESNTDFKPIRHLLDEACSLFPAFPSPFLQLSTGLAQGQESAAACYNYLCSKPYLTVEYQSDTAGILAQGEDAVLEVDMPWAKAPEVEGSTVPQGSRGRMLPVPEFARPPATSENGAPPAASFLVAWEVDAEQGIGPVLLLARAAHCLQQLHVATAGRQPVAGSELWQDLKRILQLVAALLKADPALAKPLLGVAIIYNTSQQMDWLDILIASLNVLPILAASEGGVTAARQASFAPTGPSSSSTSFGLELLVSLSEVLTAVAAVASCQPGRVMAALASCQLFAGVSLAAEQQGLVALEELGPWAQGQQEHGGAGMGDDWSGLATLQVLQETLEVPNSSYPLTGAVIHLVQCLLNQHCTWGLVPSLVYYTLNRVLAAMPWLPFKCASDRWSLAAAGLAVVRSAILSGAVATPGAAGPKAAGAPGGISITMLAAKVVHHMATAGHGYLLAVLPPPSDVLQDMAEQQAGSSKLLAAGTKLAEQLLLLVSVLLPAVSHLSPELPLQQYWGATPPGGGLSPAAIIASYATYPYATHLPLLALEALNAFAILHTGAASPGNPVPSAGGPSVPSGGATAAGVGPLGGPVQQQGGFGSAQGVNVATAAGLGVGGRGGAGGWWRPSGLFAGLFATLPGLKQSLLQPFEPRFAQEYPSFTIRTMALLEAGIRFHPEILDSMCFPSSLTFPEDKANAAGAASTPTDAGSKSSKPYSALDGLWQLLRQAPELMRSQPKLLAAVMRLLSTLWECQGSAHGAVELLRAQPDFWTTLKACCPTAGTLPAGPTGGDLSDCEAIAWQLQIHTCTLHILLLELLSVQVSSSKGVAAATSSNASGSSSHDVLLSVLDPEDISRLLVACADVGLQHQLLDQLARLLQVTYLQLGASAVVGAWGPEGMRTDALTAAAQFRREVQPLMDAAAAGEYSLEDLRVACDIMADPDNAQEVIAAALRSKQPGGDDMDDSPEDFIANSDNGQRGRVLADALSARPFGELLLSYAAVTPGSWAAGETEYSRQFLFDSTRLCQLLGPFILEATEGAIGLAITLDDLSAAAAVAHARLSLLQAVSSLFASLGRFEPARQKLMSQDVGKSLLGTSVQSVEKAMSAAVSLSSSPAARLLSVPWGLPFIGHASSTALLLTARSLLLSVRIWKVATCSGGAAAAGSSSNGRPVLMARSLNQQDLGGPAAGGSAAGTNKQQQQQQQRGGIGGFSAAQKASSVAGGSVEALKYCGQIAKLLGQWLRGKGGDSLQQAAAGAAAASSTVAADLETVGCLSTCLLLILQALPVQKAKLANARAQSNIMLNAVSADDSGSSKALTPAEVLELETALLDLLPALCGACAMVIDQQQQHEHVCAASAQQSHASAMLQLLIEILQHHLQPALWMSAVTQNLASVPLLAAAAARASSSASAAAAAEAAVTDISLLELTMAVAQAPQGALQLWQQGILDVSVGFSRQLMHTSQGTGLLDITSLGLVGPLAGFSASAAGTAAAAGISGVDLPAHYGLSLTTLGAYMSAGSNGGSSSSVQTAVGWPSAAAGSSAAAAGGCIWSPRHQQWCLLLGLLTSLLQQLSKSTDVTDLAMQLLITTEPRLMLAVQYLSSSGSSSSSSNVQGQQLTTAAAAGQQQTGIFALAWGSRSFDGLAADNLGSNIRDQAGPVVLTLANLLEAERALYLLGFMVPHLGVWQLQRPGSLAAFRSAAARLVEFVAAPSLDRSWRVSCAPLSPFERRLAKLPSGLEASDGWFKVCSAGGANNLTAAAAAAGSSGAGALSIIPADVSSPRVSAGSPTAAAAGAGSSSRSFGGCSEYCARLCEAVYTACEHSLRFLLATAPAVEPGEVAAAAAGGGEGLGPMWPSAKALAALQDQVLAVGTSMVQHPQSLTDRRRRVAAACVRIAAAAGQLLEAVSPSRWSGARGRGGVDAAVADVARRREKMVQISRGLTQA